MFDNVLPMTPKGRAPRSSFLASGPARPPAPAPTPAQAPARPPNPAPPAQSAPLPGHAPAPAPPPTPTPLRVTSALPEVELLQPPPLETLESRARDAVELASAFVSCLAELGVKQAFGVSGGSIGRIYDAFNRSPIEHYHFRHETGAAFAAAEAHFASGRPTAVFATTGPGLVNALNGLTAARWDGAKIILITGSTSAAQRGRWATQETTSHTMSQDTLFAEGRLFDYALCVQDPSEMHVVARRLASGVASKGRFMAHISLPIALQSMQVERPDSILDSSGEYGTPTERVSHCAEILRRGPFALWLGFGARNAAGPIRELVERSGAHVFCSSRGKGIVPESHPQFLGVTGIGGHDAVTDYMARHRPKWVMVLGSRLGEPTSFWDPTLQPAEGFIHVDLDPTVPGTAYPNCHTVAVQGDIADTVRRLIPYFPESRPQPVTAETRRPNGPQERLQTAPLRLASRGVRPQELMRGIQYRVVENSDALVMSDCGNSFVWCSHYLFFDEPNRYRLNTFYGSMGHFAVGVVGAALAREDKAVAVVGDGSMLMHMEIGTAVQYDAPAVWIVLNDGGYQICREGHKALGLQADGLEFPRANLAMMARALGAEGIEVESEIELVGALDHAMSCKGPCLVDVHIDTTISPPMNRRFESLMRQARGGHSPTPGPGASGSGAYRRPGFTE